jgi:hypothetical protein
MNRRVKVILYVGLLLAAAMFLYCFLTENRLVNEKAAGASGSRMLTYAAAFFGTLVGFGLLVAWEFSHYLGQKAEEFVFNDEGEGVHDPEYDEAEQLWANGRHLDAISHLREFLKKDPRQIHAAIRIAEIYEKDLNNPLAAALEYEEILTKKLPPERWGWSAIHLVNLYKGPLRKEEQAVALLERIAHEHPRTGAAKKARARLGLPEPVEATPEAGAEAETETAPTPETPKSNLPPGFRPK